MSVSGRFTLGITTAGPVAAALVGDGIEHASATTDQALNGALHCVIDVLAQAHASLQDVASISVCRGPGSFTGLRIGVALAKSIAQARSIPIVGVSSYEVAEQGAPDGGWPRAAVVEGKRDYYYARRIDTPDAAPIFQRGSRGELADVLDGADARWLADVSPAEQALRVAHIGRQAAAAGGDWRGVEIDYGQRPNAVANWELRHQPRERGVTAKPSKPDP